MDYFQAYAEYNHHEVRKHLHLTFFQWQPLPPNLEATTLLTFKTVRFFSLVLPPKYKFLNYIVSFCPFFTLWK